MELFRGDRPTGELFRKRAQQLAHRDKDWKNERVLEMPEVVDGQTEKRPTDPESCSHQNSQ